MAILLSVNAGSSSVKVSVYRASSSKDEPQQLAEAQIAGLTSPPAKLTYTRGDTSIKDEDFGDSVSSQADAFDHILTRISSDDGLKEISGDAGSSITHVCHRVVHGGSYSHAQEITKDTLEEIERLTDLAPLHNAAALDIIRKVGEKLPKARNIAVFDSSFHSTLPAAVAAYAIDRSIAEQNGLRRYGFHGISYSFITRAVAKHLGKSVETVNVIALHLGSGASACAIKNGRSVDTSMGLTPLSGLPGATRSGDVDAALVFHMTHEAGRMAQSASKELHVTLAEDLLNKKSGWKSICGTTDFGEIVGSDKEECKLAFDLFVDRIVGYIGSYHLKLDGEVDALVFAGGIGEKSAELRSAVARRCRAIGVELDKAKNEAEIKDVVGSISKADARTQTLIVKTDEQWEMARSVVADEQLFRT